MAAGRPTASELLWPCNRIPEALHRFAEKSTFGGAVSEKKLGHAGFLKASVPFLFDLRFCFLATPSFSCHLIAHALCCFQKHPVETCWDKTNNDSL
jgi:hypothetical protein